MTISPTVQPSRYFLPIAIVFVVFLLTANIAATKLLLLGPFVVAGGIIVFPITYIFGDILTEVYGYRASRKIIWSGFFALLLMSLTLWIVGRLPAAPFWHNQEAYHIILDATPRIIIASIVAYAVGEFSNSIILSKLKVITKGKHLWTRTIGSTVIGEGVDSVIFAFIAFAGSISVGNILTLIWSGYFLKVVYEIIATPLTYIIVKKLKEKEGVDVYDTNIQYNPFFF